MQRPRGWRALRRVHERAYEQACERACERAYERAYERACERTRRWTVGRGDERGSGLKYTL